jgi:hypothetical protein
MAELRTLIQIEAGRRRELGIVSPSADRSRYRNVSICNDLMAGIGGSNDLSADGYIGIRIRERQTAGMQYNMIMIFDLLHEIPELFVLIDVVACELL